MSTFINCYVIVSEVSTGKSQTEILQYWPSNSQADMAKLRFEIPREDRTLKVNKLFIVGLFSLSFQAHNRRVGITGE